MIITVSAIKGGVGKTTLAMILGETFARHSGRTVGVLDLDPQGSAIEMRNKTLGMTVPVAVTDLGSVGKLPRRIRDHAAEYDILLVDTPPGHIDVADAAIGESDFLLIPTQPEYEPLRQAVTTFKDFEASSAALVLNKITPTANDAVRARTLIEDAGLPLLDTELPDWVSIKRLAGGEWKLDARTIDLVGRLAAEVVTRASAGVTT